MSEDNISQTEDIQDIDDLPEAKKLKEDVPSFVSERRRRFAEEYIKDFNGAAAAVRAGYTQKQHSARHSAQRLLNEPEVQAMIREFASNAVQRNKVYIDGVLAELARIATVDFAQAFNEDGSLKRLSDIPEDVRRAIAGLEIKEYFEGSGEERVQVGWIKKIKFNDKNKALELLGKYLAMWVDQTKHTGSLTLEQAIAETMKKKDEQNG